MKTSKDSREPRRKDRLATTNDKSRERKASEAKGKEKERERGGEKSDFESEGGRDSEGSSDMGSSSS